MCSTPFGITGRSTAARWARSPARRRRAQRLSASPGGAPTICPAGRTPCQCSTPFGITGRSTCQRPSWPHHGVPCSTPFGITGRSTTASLPKPGTMTSSAQRLSASPGGARRRRGPLPPVDPVLNAFRHHREEHAQRRAAAAGRARHVLNAFRHHREEHNLPAIARSLAVGCSTPFGITGRSTRPVSAPWSAPACAQRLSASPGGALSTFCALPVLAWSAQRLSASPGGAPLPDLIVALVGLCSTPFGITGRSTGSHHGTSSRAVATCSTPFGITGRSTSSRAKQPAA